MDPIPRLTASDEETYTTVSSLPPKRRAGRIKFHETRHPVYKGVRRRNTDRWVCEVREPNKKSRIWLGTFPTPEMAARAHDVAALALRGRSACLNFADSARLLPVPESTSPRDIQRAAAIAAELFRPENLGNDGINGAAVLNQQKSQGGDCSNSSTANYNNELLFEEDGLYFDMAQGMLIDPPPMTTMTPDFELEGDDDWETSLWSYSI